MCGAERVSHSSAKFFGAFEEFVDVLAFFRVRWLRFEDGERFLRNESLLRSRSERLINERFGFVPSIRERV